MRWSWNFARGVGLGSRPDCQKTGLTTFFSHQLILQFYRGCPMVISKKTIIFRFQRGSNIFLGGPNTNFYRNPYNLWFSRRVQTPYAPSGSAHVMLGAQFRLSSHRRLYFMFASIECFSKVSKVAKMRNRYNQAPHLTQDTTWESEKNTTKHHKHEPRGQPFPSRRPQSSNEQTGKHDKHKT